MIHSIRITTIIFLLSIRNLIASDQSYDVVNLKTSEIGEGYSDYHDITNTINISTESFAVRSQLGWVTAAEYNRLKLTNGEIRIFSPLHSKAFAIKILVDSAKKPCEQMKVQFVIFQEGQAKREFNFESFKDIDANWIDEKLLEIISWHGTRIKSTELINVETGKIIYKSVEGIYDRLES